MLGEKLRRKEKSSKSLLDMRPRVEGTLRLYNFSNWTVIEAEKVHYLNFWSFISMLRVDSRVEVGGLRPFALPSIYLRVESTILCSIGYWN